MLRVNTLSLRAHVFLALSSVILAGCATTPSISATPTVKAAATQATRITGIGESIIFDVGGGTRDVEGPSPEVLTLVEASRRALLTDSELQSAMARVRAAEAEVDQAKLLPNPILNVGFRPSFGGTAIIDAGLAIDLVTFMTRNGRVSVADARLRAASASVLTTALDVLSDVQQRYVAIQALDEQMPILEERRKLLERLLSLAESRLRVGEGTRLDVTTLRAQEVELEVEIADRELDRRRERLALARLIGQPSGGINWKLSKWSIPERPSVTEQAWLKAALTSRPEIIAKRMEIVALGGEVRLAKFGPFESTEASLNAERDDTWSVGPSLSVPVPIFDWGQARSDKASAQLVEARHQLTKSARQIVEDVRRSLETFSATWAALQRVRNELIPIQEQRRDQAESQYKAGQTDLTALVLAEQDLRSAKLRAIDLQRKTGSALIELHRAVGGPQVVAQLSAAPTTRPTSQPATTRSSK